MAEFKKITDVPYVDEPLEGDNLLIVSDNKLKQISASSFAAASGSGSGFLPVYVYGGSTSGNQGYIFDPNNVGISTFEQLFEYMTVGGPVLYTNATSGNIGTDLIPVCLVKDSGSTSGKFWYISEDRTHIFGTID